MLKIFSVEQTRRADAFTIENEPIASIDLMERAAKQCFEWILEKLAGSSPAVYVFCGTGNNGGDGLAIARMFTAANYKVTVAIPQDASKFSKDFEANLLRLRATECGVVSLSESLTWIPQENDILVDALFGSGLSKPLKGEFEEVIKFINQSQGSVISIDIPSGLFADSPAEIKKSDVVKADYTLSFQLPKLAFFMPENDEFIGEWVVLPIGLLPQFIESEPCKSFYISGSDIRPLLKVRKKFSHKGTYGHALILAGSLGKTGAAVLSAKACLRSGAGLVTSHIPRCGYEIMQSSVPEVMVSIDPSFDECSRLPDLSPFNAIGAGPGFGSGDEARSMVKLIMQEVKVPLVLDADALNILAENKTWLAFVPAGSILTPHPKEFERLAGKTNDSFERLALLRDFCIRNKVYLVLKGAYTVTCTPTGNCFFNSTGNPGMATAGSGDVLTGILTGLLAQGYTQVEACLLGVYLHGLAGDLAALQLGEEAVMAGDIIENLGNAYKELYANVGKWQE